MQKQEYQLNRGTHAFVLDFINKLVLTGKNYTITLQDYKERGTDAQRKTYFMWMRELADWANDRGYKQEVWSNGKKILEKPWDVDFAHEFVMLYFYPKNEDGSRKSLKELLKSRGDMCFLLDRLIPWGVDRQLMFTIPNKHWYWDEKQ